MPTKDIKVNKFKEKITLFIMVLSRKKTVKTRIIDYQKCCTWENPTQHTKITSKSTLTSKQVLRHKKQNTHKIITKDKRYIGNNLFILFIFNIIFTLQFCYATTLIKTTSTAIVEQLNNVNKQNVTIINYGENDIIQQQDEKKIYDFDEQQTKQRKYRRPQTPRYSVYKGKRRKHMRHPINATRRSTVAATKIFKISAKATATATATATTTSWNPEIYVRNQQQVAVLVSTPTIQQQQHQQQHQFMHIQHQQQQQQQTFLPKLINATASGVGAVQSKQKQQHEFIYQIPKQYMQYGGRNFTYLHEQHQEQHQQQHQHFSYGPQQEKNKSNNHSYNNNRKDHVIVEGNTEIILYHNIVGPLPCPPGFLPHRVVPIYAKLQPTTNQRHRGKPLLPPHIQKHQTTTTTILLIKSKKIKKKGNPSIFFDFLLVSHNIYN